MINKYYLLPMEDAHIVNYSQVVGEVATEFNNTGFFICKTFEGVINDIVMQPYKPIKKADLKIWMKENSEQI